MSANGIDHVIVAVPARDEESTLAECLASVRIACSRIEVPATIVVALDACADDSLAVARRFPDVVVVECDHGNVGRSRHTAVEAGLRQAGSDSARTWIAFTDADTVVPPAWLRAHLACAATADAFVGAVIPRLDDLDGGRRGIWRRTHPAGATLGHVHGANLGVRASAYRAVGGMLPLTVGEDVNLIARLRAAGRRIAESERHPTVTSARLVGRAPGGYAAYLLDLVP